MGRTYGTIAGEEMMAHVKSRYLGTSDIYNIQIRLGYRKGKEFFPQEWLEWTQDVRAELGINEFEIPCPVPLDAPAGTYDAEVLISIPGIPYPENREIRVYRDNVALVKEV